MLGWAGGGSRLKRRENVAVGTLRGTMEVQYYFKDSFEIRGIQHGNTQLLEYTNEQVCVYTIPKAL